MPCRMLLHQSEALRPHSSPRRIRALSWDRLMADSAATPVPPRLLMHEHETGISAETLLLPCCRAAEGSREAVVTTLATTAEVRVTLCVRP